MHFLIDAILDWSWPQKIVAATLLIFVNILYFLATGKVHTWLVSIPLILLIFPFFFADKEPPLYDEKEHQDLVHKDFFMDFDQFRYTFTRFNKATGNSISEDKVNNLFKHSILESTYPKNFNFSINSNRLNGSLSLSTFSDGEVIQFTLATNPEIADHFTKINSLVIEENS